MAIGMSHSALNFHSSSPSPGTSYPTSPVIVAFTVGVLICFVGGFCFIYICRCCFMNHLYTWIFHRPNNLRHQIHSPAATAAPAAAVDTAPPGLDPALLRNFPVFTYLSVKELQEKNSNNNKKKYGLECAICLLEFEEDSLLRLLTVCRHVFHQECIDLWLEFHKTCPVCRTDLESSSNDETKFRDHQNQIRMEENNLDDGFNENEIRIDVRGEEEEEVVSEKRFRRSHSTGHSIVMMKGRGGRRSNNYNDGDDEGKYTLKLPEHVEMKLVRGHIAASKSCSSYGEMTRNCKRYYAEAISGSSNSNNAS